MPRPLASQVNSFPNFNNYEPGAAALAQKIAGGFEQAVESILKDNERYLEDERFWYEELGLNAPLSNLEMFSSTGG